MRRSKRSIFHWSKTNHQTTVLCSSSYQIILCNFQTLIHMNGMQGGTSMWWSCFIQLLAYRTRLTNNVVICMNGPFNVKIIKPLNFKKPVQYSRAVNCLSNKLYKTRCAQAIFSQDDALECVFKSFSSHSISSLYATAQAPEYKRTIQEYTEIVLRSGVQILDGFMYSFLGTRKQIQRIILA